MIYISRITEQGKKSLVVLSLVSKQPIGTESSNLLHIYIWRRSTEWSESYGIVIFISRMIENKTTIHLLCLTHFLSNK